MIYVYPQYVIDYVMKKHKAMPFYEYYFEPAGKKGMVTFQFMHENYEDGMKAKKHLETMIDFAQYLFIFLLLCILFIFSFNKMIAVILIVIVGMLFNTRFLNPLGVQYQQWKSMKQMIFE
jgi:hypothetical protein